MLCIVEIDWTSFFILLDSYFFLNLATLGDSLLTEPICASESRKNGYTVHHFFLYAFAIIRKATLLVR